MARPGRLRPLQSEEELVARPAALCAWIGWSPASPIRWNFAAEGPLGGGNPMTRTRVWRSRTAVPDAGSQAGQRQHCREQHRIAANRNASDHLGRPRIPGKARRYFTHGRVSLSPEESTNVPGVAAVPTAGAAQDSRWA